jgi:DNA replication ATP-dependent helicase Dna2
VALDFERRLLRFLASEESGEHKTLMDLRALPADARALEGECIAAAQFEAAETNAGGAEEAWLFRAPENASKFRVGDAVAVGDGRDFDAAWPLVYAGWDEEHGRLRLERDPFGRRDEAPEFEVDKAYCVDRRPIGLRGRLHEAVRAGFADDWIRRILCGEVEKLPEPDAGRMERALDALGRTDLDEVQVRAGADLIATESLALVQGPPGTGKTRLIAEVIRVLARAGCRIALTAFTHRAVDNVLFAVRRLDRSLPLVKLGNPGGSAKALRAAGVRTLDPRRGSLPPRGCLIAGTCFALQKLPSKERFHYTVFDEAGQLPIPHAMVGMLLSTHWLFVGDHRQLPPVVTARHADRDVTRSVFEHLHDLYGSRMLEATWRMNRGVCDVIGGVFYGGRLRSASAVADRRMPFAGVGGRFDAVLTPDAPVVRLRVGHSSPCQRNRTEADLVASMVDELLHRHGISAQEIAVVAPFRAQVRAVRNALQRHGVAAEEEGALLVDTVERAQGQEREVVILTLACGEPAALGGRSDFFLSPNRLNVALSRARTKAVLVCADGAFEALPQDPDALRGAACFRALAARIPCIDADSLVGDRVASAGELGRTA